MTERPKNTSRNKISCRDKDISLEVFCKAPSPQVAEKNDTSVYEIDIRSDYGFFNRSAKMKSVDSNSRELEGRKKSKGSKDMRNPFIQSHYPNFLEISSDFIEAPNEELNPEPKIEIVEESEIPAEKADKENQSPSRHSNDKFDKYIKSYIIDNFFSSKNKDLKGFFQKCESKLNSKGLHFHHHEHHHHHYYFDKTSVSQASGETETSKQETKAPFGKRERKNCEHDQIEKQSLEICATGVKSNATFTRVNVQPDKPPKETKNVKCGPSFRFKNSPSVESVLFKKSEFIKSHVFSDTDLTKRDSDEITEADTLEVSSTEASQSGKTKYDILLKNLKNFNDLKLPVVITDQKTVPKVSYITCQCPSSDLLENVSNIVLINSEKSEKKNTDVEKTSASDDSVNQEGIDQRSSSTSSKKFRFETWTAKLREELREIKKELRRIEERHSKKTESSFAQFRSKNKTQNRNPKHTRRISVYSSKTFVISPDDVSLNKKPESKQVEKSSKSGIHEEGPVLNGTQMDEVLLGPGEGTKVTDKQSTEKEYKEYCLYKYEQTYSNGSYNCPNKILL